jgi:2-hexadecenal reductase
MAKHVYGIDLGTTYSCIATIDDTGRAEVIKNLEGNNTTPSVVQLGDDIVVGETAKNETIIESEKTVSLVKTIIGKSDTAIRYNGRNISPEEISSYILKKLANDASEQMGEEVKDVVITCPAYFGTAEREATKKAGKLAGLNVLEIINEPTAAALYYGCSKEHEEKTILVYDLGGGTFDVTIMRITSTIKVICSDGDHDLGGKDWDGYLVQVISNKIIESVGEVEFDESAQQELRLNAENMKKALTGKQKAKAVFYKVEGSPKIEVTRDEFNRATESLLNSTLSKTEDAIKIAADKGYGKIDEILLVGGSTKMPQVKEALSEKYRDCKIQFLEPDEAVAKGAAIHAVNVYLNNKKAIEDKTFNPKKKSGLNPEDYKEDLKVDKRSMSIGGIQREVIMATTKSFAVKIKNRVGKIECFNMIIKNNSLEKGFIEVSDEFCTEVDNQQCVDIRIYENDFMEKTFDVDEEFFIGNAILELPANLPKGSPLKITLKLNSEGILEVDGLDETGNNKVNVKMETKGVMSDEKFEEVKELVKDVNVI